MLAYWSHKFACAFRGIFVGMRGQSSFAVHLPAALAVLIVGTICNVSWPKWYILLLCVTIVLAAELFNTAIEKLAKAITHEQHPEIRDALDIASGAVLVTAIGAAVVGVLVVV
jgi:diacylglycerol kinase